MALDDDAGLPDIATAGLRCPNCGYDLTGLPLHRCPECDRAFDPRQLRANLAMQPVPMTLRAVLLNMLVVPAAVGVIALLALYLLGTYQGLLFGALTLLTWGDWVTHTVASHLDAFSRPWEPARARGDSQDRASVHRVLLRARDTIFALLWCRLARLDSASQPRRSTPGRRSVTLPGRWSPNDMAA